MGTTILIQDGRVERLFVRFYCPNCGNGEDIQLRRENSKDKSFELWCPKCLHSFLISFTGISSGFYKREAE